MKAFKQAPDLYTLEHIRDHVLGKNRVMADFGGRWVPARPLGYFSWRWRCKVAWLVFTGRADAFTWPEGQ